MGNETFYGDGLMKFVHDIFLISLCTGMEGDMGVYGIEVLSFFSSGISEILILMCGLRYHSAVRYAVFHPSG